MRILYVEDNEVNLALVQRIARMGGHEILSHSNGVDALKTLETEEVDLILMDIEIDGELDGTQVTEKLRARGDKRPIIAVTAYAMKGDRERIVKHGFDGYLPKPIPVSELLAIIAKYDPKNSVPEVVQPIDEPIATIKDDTLTRPMSTLTPPKKHQTGRLNPDVLKDRKLKGASDNQEPTSEDKPDAKPASPVASAQATPPTSLEEKPATAGSVDSDWEDVPESVSRSNESSPPVEKSEATTSSQVAAEKSTEASTVKTGPEDKKLP